MTSLFHSCHTQKHSQQDFLILDNSMHHLILTQARQMFFVEMFLVFDFHLQQFSFGISFLGMQMPLSRFSGLTFWEISVPHPTILQLMMKLCRFAMGADWAGAFIVYYYHFLFPCPHRRTILQLRVLVIKVFCFKLAIRDRHRMVAVLFGAMRVKWFQRILAGNFPIMGV